MPLIVARSTYLSNPDDPTFIIGVPGILTGTPVKPVAGSIMLGPLVEFINNYWPLWDVETGDTVADIILGNNGTMSGDLTWQPAEYGQGIGGSPIVGTDKIAIQPVNLTGSYSLERLISLDGAWTYEVTVYDEDANLITKYVNGVSSNTAPYSSVPTVISDLIAWDGSALTNPVILEFARIWNRALTSYEVADLYASPYSVFGMTQEILDEITTIVNFMKPMNTSWSFVTI